MSGGVGVDGRTLVNIWRSLKGGPLTNDPMADETRSASRILPPSPPPRAWARRGWRDRGRSRGPSGRSGGSTASPAPPPPRGMGPGHHHPGESQARARARFGKRRLGPLAGGGALSKRAPGWGGGQKQRLPACGRMPMRWPPGRVTTVSTLARLVRLSFSSHADRGCRLGGGEGGGTRGLEAKNRNLKN